MSRKFKLDLCNTIVNWTFVTNIIVQLIPLIRSRPERNSKGPHPQESKINRPTDPIERSPDRSLNREVTDRPTDRFAIEIQTQDTINRSESRRFQTKQTELKPENFYGQRANVGRAGSLVHSADQPEQKPHPKISLGHLGRTGNDFAFAS